MTTNLTPRLTGVTIQQNTGDLAKDVPYSVFPIFTIPVVGETMRSRSGYGVKDRKMADRLAAAMMAGVVYGEAELKYDVNGDPYVSAHGRVLARMINADLRRLGF